MYPLNILNHGSSGVGNEVNILWIWNEIHPFETSLYHRHDCSRHTYELLFYNRDAEIEKIIKKIIEQIY